MGYYLKGMPWPQRLVALIRILLILLLLAAACSRLPGRREAPLPELPKLALANFPPATREEIQKALGEAQAKPRDAEAAGRLGMLLQAHEQLEAAEACFERARRLDPNRFQWVYYLGVTQATAGKNADAAATLEAAVRLDPDYLPARLKLAELLVGLNRLRESREIAQSIVKEDAALAPAYYWLGRVATAEGQAGAAAGHYRQATELWSAYGAAHYALALAYQKLGEKAKAAEQLTAYQKYQRDEPPDADSLLEVVRALNNTALTHLMNGADLETTGEFEAAKAEYEQALQVNPRLAQAHANLISIYGRLGQPEPARQHYRAAVDIDPNLPEIHYNYGVLLLSQRRVNEAEAAFKRALEISPNYPEAHNNLAAILESRGKFDEAIRHCRVALENKPNYRLARFHLAHLLLQRRQNDEAIYQLEQTLTPEDAQTPTFMYSLAGAYAQSGDVPSARRYLQEARQRAASWGQAELVAEIDQALRSIR